jgi:aspartyl-tRNA(Asn)/glutamyl-tRNA(Gln) amidotransferase subunit A
MGVSKILEHRDLLLSGKITNEHFVTDIIQKIKNNSDLNCFLEVFEETAVKRAKELDEKLKNTQKIGKLFGTVVAIKDNICYKGHRVSAASKILKGFESLFSATCVERLLNEDAIIIGRTNCDEFAMGSSNENSAYGNVKNPLDKTRVPGGSSGGSAAAVAAGLCHVALGSDTGGSIRQPAAFTGTIGLKPTYGRVSRWGLIAYASSFDQIGPITETAMDAALVMEVISGADEYDATCSDFPVEKYSEINSQKLNYSFSYIKETLDLPGLDLNIKESFIEFIETLKRNGHTVEPVSYPYLEYLVPAYYVLTTAEASSNLARYDGVHFGYRSPNAKTMEEVYVLSRSEGFGKEVKRRIMLGTFVLSAGYYDAYYARAQKVRRIIRDKTKEILSQYDFILTPTTPGFAFEFGKNATNPIQMYLEDIFTVQAPLAGIPAISVPFDVLNENRFKAGIQIMADEFREKKIFDLLYQLGY